MNDEDFKGLLRGLDEARRHARGERVPGLHIHHVPVEDIRATPRRLTVRSTVPTG